MDRDVLLRARWVVPVEFPPLPHGAVLVRDGRVAAVGAAREIPSPPGVAVRDLGAAILLPGPVNAHTHLSLTGIASRIPREGPLLDWLARVTREAAGLTPEEVRAAVRSGLEASRRMGTAAIGEITTRADGASEIERGGRIAARVYFEFLGVGAERASRRYEAAVAAALALANRQGPASPVRAGLSPHAPYSVWPSLWEAAAGRCRELDLRWSSHVAESPYEQEFLTEGRGPLRDHLVGMGVWDDAYPFPRTGILDYWESRGVLDARALLVHGLHLADRDLDRIADSGAAVCLCPRSNAVLGLPPPPLTGFLSRGIPLCLGTDSLASNEDLGVWGEMRALRRIDPDLPADRILRMATLNGARALGLEDQCGAIRPGLPARLAAVLLSDPEPVDPLEYLVAEPVENRMVPEAPGLPSIP